MSLFRYVLSTNLLPITKCSKCLLKPEVFWPSTGSRFIFSSERLGIENYKRLRQEYDNKLGHKRDQFMESAKKFMNMNVPMVYTADLKAMIHMAETPDEIELLTQMIKIHNERASSISFGQFHYGPLVMRLLYVKRDWATALHLYTNPDLDKSGFFDQVSSIKVLMQLLLEEHCYDDVHKIMAISMRKQLKGVKYWSDCLMIAVAACLKENTEESFLKMKDYIDGASASVNGQIPHRAILHGALLSMKQNKLIDAWDILMKMPSIQERRNRQQGLDNMQLLYYARTQNVPEGFTLLGDLIHSTESTYQNNVFSIFQEVYVEFKDMVMKIGDREQKHSMQEIDARMKEGNHLIDVILEQFLFRTIISNEISKAQNKFKRNEQDRKKQFNKHRNLGFIEQ